MFSHVRRALVGGALSDGGGCSDWMFDILGADTMEKRSNLEMQALLEAPVSPPPVSLLMLPFLSGERAPGLVRCSTSHTKNCNTVFD